MYLEMHIKLTYRWMDLAGFWSELMTAFMIAI